MNYEEMKAQFEAEENGTPSNRRSGKNKHVHSNPNRRPRTPLDSLIGMIPYVLVFGAAMGIGTWYLQDTHAANEQFKKLIGMTVVNTEVVDEEETEEPESKVEAKQERTEL